MGIKIYQDGQKKRKLKLDIIKNFQQKEQRSIRDIMVPIPGELTKHLLNWNDQEKIGLTL